jgi:hypothetical protein
VLPSVTKRAISSGPHRIRAREEPDVRIGAVLSGLICIAGGVIMLIFEGSADPSTGVGSGYSLTGHTIFETIAHGLGLYCIGRGIFIVLSADFIHELRADVREIATSLRRRVPERLD